MGREDEREGVAGRAKGKSFKSKKKEDNRRDGKRRKGVKKDKNFGNVLQTVTFIST